MFTDAYLGDKTVNKSKDVLSVDVGVGSRWRQKADVRLCGGGRSGGAKGF